MKKKMDKDFASFRDPAGFIYYEKGRVKRRINSCYFKQYEHFMNSGLYDELVQLGYLVSHREVERNDDYITLEVEKIPFITYPYEWCFEELKDAAILTLNILELALKYGMILKDASGYNVQFWNGKPIFIDTLSFDFYEEGLPWGAYGQFCRHFMAPLLLMKYVDERSNCLLKNYIDGIPIDLANNLLHGRGGFTAKCHIKWHSKSIAKNNDHVVQMKQIHVSKSSIINMTDMMIRQISKLKHKVVASEWEDYYQHTNYNEQSDKDKEQLVISYLEKVHIKEKDVVFDLGANEGKYSRIASCKKCMVVSWDIDFNCIHNNYMLLKKNQEKNILPLYLDCTNPTPDLGFGCLERKSLNRRGPVKCVMALALIHHIAISNNVFFDEIAEWFSKLGEYLIIEFVPKEDSQVQKLLQTRKDIFNWYDEEIFEKSFQKYFTILKKDTITNSKRVMYLMKGI